MNTSLLFRNILTLWAIENRQPPNLSLTSTQIIKKIVMKAEIHELNLSKFATNQTLPLRISVLKIEFVNLL
jgi:hypothetical protein